jgi:hypothetical protein
MLQAGWAERQRAGNPIKANVLICEIAGIKNAHGEGTGIISDEDEVSAELTLHFLNFNGLFWNLN